MYNVPQSPKSKSYNSNNNDSVNQRHLFYATLYVSTLHAI